MNNFWNQNITTNPAMMSMSTLLDPSSNTTIKYGRLPQGGCARCFSSICGGVDPNTGRPLPDKPCGPSDVFNCYYPSDLACNSNEPRRQQLTQKLSTAPFSFTMKTVFDQPNYADAAQTFFAGRN